MEFKDKPTEAADLHVCKGLIESDWNLKLERLQARHAAWPGLIESDWNLKFSPAAVFVLHFYGLIESDWNLKQTAVDLL